MKMKLLRLARQSLVRFAKDRRGSVPLLVALGTAMFIGIASLAIDSSFHYVLRGKLQAAADATALAAASQLPDPDDTRTMAQEYAAKNMLPEVHGLALRQEDIILGSWAEQTRTFTPAATPVNAVRVILRRAEANDNAAPTFFARLFGIDEVDIVVSALATSPVFACLLALDPDSENSLTLDSNAQIAVTGCDVQANSSDSKGLSALSNSTLSADATCVVGDYEGDDSHYTPNPDTGCSPAADPLASLAAPAVGPCDENNYFLGASQEDTLSPGVYCGGITIDSDATAHFDPGIYIVKDGEFRLLSNVSADGVGVSFYLTGDAATLFFDSNTQAEFSAPTSGPMTGVVIFQDPNYGGEHRIDSNTYHSFEGFVYLPNGNLSSDSNGVVNANSSCAFIIANQIHFNSNAGFVMDYDPSTCGVPLPPSFVAATRVVLRQ